MITAPTTVVELMNTTPTKQQCLTEALRLIDFFVACATTNEVPVVSLGTFKTIRTMKKVEAQL